MSESIPLNKLERLLHLSGVDVSPKKGNDFRNHYFSVLGRDYRIEWWTNICYLYTNGMQIPSYNVELSGTWPNHAKTNLQFYYDTKEVCCILPIEEYSNRPLGTTYMVEILCK